MLRWLNREKSLQDYVVYGKPTNPSRERILRLISAISDANAVLDLAVEREPSRRFWAKPPAFLTKALKTLQHQLNEYPMWQTVEIAPKHDGGGLQFNLSSGPGRPLGEQIAAWAIVDLARNGWLHLLRQCECEKWFVAKRYDQKACTGNCRHKRYEQTDAFKVKRRKYMREYYALKKSGKVR